MLQTEILVFGANIIDNSSLFCVMCYNINPPASNMGQTHRSRYIQYVAQNNGISCIYGTSKAPQNSKTIKVFECYICWEGVNTIVTPPCRKDN